MTRRWSAAFISAVLLVVACSPTSSVSSPTSTPSAITTPSPSTSPAPGATAPVRASASAAAAASPQPYPPIQFLEPGTLFVGSWPGVARSDDSGATWTPLALPPYARFEDLRMIDREQGWSILFFLRDQAQIGCMQAGTAAPCHSAVAVTSDAGRSWRAMLTSPLNPGGGSTIDHLQAVDAMHAWVLVTSACDTRGVCDKELRATADGGVTWRTERTGRIRQLRVASLARAWISVDAENGSVISATADGGASWHEQMVTTQPVISLDAASDRQAWVLTEDGSYCTASSCSRYELLFTGDGGTTWSSLSNPKDNVVAGPTCTTGHLSGPVFADAQIGWLGVSRGVGGGAGSSGIMRTKDGGRTWTCAVVPPDVERVSVADPRRILVLSRDARSAAYSPSLSVDGGASWTVLTLR